MPFSSISRIISSFQALTSLNKGQRPYEVTEILKYDLDGEQAKQLANAELDQLKKEYTDREKEKEQIESEFLNYREENLPKNIAGLIQFNQNVGGNIGY